MARGAASVLDVAGGVCVTDHPEPVPDTMRLVIGDHPVPGPASLEAGAAVLEAVQSAPPSMDIVALVSGGGSALCEAPRDGVPAGFLSEVTRRLISGGADIEELNLVRGHLSAIKCGGVARAAGRPIDTFVISDVAGAGSGRRGLGADHPAGARPGSGRGRPERAVDRDPGWGVGSDDEGADVTAESGGHPVGGRPHGRSWCGERDASSRHCGR